MINKILAKFFSRNDQMRLTEIRDLFEIDNGAPCPLLLSADGIVRLIFYGNAINGQRFKQRDVLNDIGIIELRFTSCSFQSFSPPNDEALNGHPYYNIGLSSCGFFEVLNSDLIKKIESYNRFHQRNNPNSYRNSHHYVITFKETVFECVADDFELFQYDESVYSRGVKSLHELYGVKL